MNFTENDKEILFETRNIEDFRGALNWLLENREVDLETLQDLRESLINHYTLFLRAGEQLDEVGRIELNSRLRIVDPLIEEQRRIEAEQRRMRREIRERRRAKNTIKGGGKKSSIWEIPNPVWQSLPWEKTTINLPWEKRVNNPFMEGGRLPNNNELEQLKTQSWTQFRFNINAKLDLEEIDSAQDILYILNNLREATQVVDQAIKIRYLERLYAEASEIDWNTNPERWGGSIPLSPRQHVGFPIPRPMRIRNHVDRYDRMTPQLWHITPNHFGNADEVLWLMGELRRRNSDNLAFKLRALRNLYREMGYDILPGRGKKGKIGGFLSDDEMESLKKLQDQTYLIRIQGLSYEDVERLLLNIQAEFRRVYEEPKTESNLIIKERLKNKFFPLLEIYKRMVEERREIEKREEEENLGKRGGLR